MRIIVFFDLPVKTTENKRNYSKFRRFLIKNGFIMLQQSVYCRMALNQSVLTAIINNLKKNKPDDGIVQILSITEKQFEKMEYVTGSFNTDIISNDERLIVL